MKWLTALIIITFFFIIAGFVIPIKDIFSFRWMTLGVAAVAFLQYFIVVKSNKKTAQNMIVGHLSGIVLKFILSFIVLILYIVLFGIESGNLPVIYFFVALVLYSFVNYIGSYNS